MNPDKKPLTDAEIMAVTYWWGIPTLFRCEIDEDPSNVDIGLVGIPHSAGNGLTERDQHLGRQGRVSATARCPTVRPASAPTTAIRQRRPAAVSP